MIGYRMDQNISKLLAFIQKIFRYAQFFRGTPRAFMESLELQKVRRYNFFTANYKVLCFPQKLEAFLKVPSSVKKSHTCSLSLSLRLVKYKMKSISKIRSEFILFFCFIHCENRIRKFVSLIRVDISNVPSIITC